MTDAVEVTQADEVLVPRDLLAAACYCIRKYAGVSSETYRRLSVLSLAPRALPPITPDEPRANAGEGAIPAGMVADRDRDGFTDPTGFVWPGKAEWDRHTEADRLAFLGRLREHRAQVASVTPRPASPASPASVEQEQGR